ncbi:hypothetical protein VTO73DRAFT_3435 [Trametes versicolor]
MPGELRFGSLAVVEIQMASGHCSLAGLGEKTPLLSEEGGIPSRQKIEVKAMRYADLPKGVDTAQTVLHDQAMMEYLISADTWPFFETRWKLKHGLYMADGISQHRMLTVNRGDSNLRYAVPGNRNIRKVFAWLSDLARLFDPPEVQKRWKECMEATGALAQSSFGDRIEEMYEIQTLGTAPKAQGNGFASALVTTITDMGDADGHDVWVLTTSAYGFYEMLGFSIIGQATVGADNPKWDGDPVTLRVMLRPASTTKGTV